MDLFYVCNLLNNNLFLKYKLVRNIIRTINCDCWKHDDFNIARRCYIPFSLFRKSFLIHAIFFRHDLKSWIVF